MAKTGDRVVLTTQRVGQAPRTGTVEAVNGTMLTVSWDSGDRTTFIPAAGSLEVTGRAPDSP